MRLLFTDTILLLRILFSLHCFNSFELKYFLLILNDAMPETV